MKKLLTIVSLFIATPVLAQVPSTITTKEQAMEYIRMYGEVTGRKQCAVMKRTDLLESQIDSEIAYLRKKGYNAIDGIEYRFKISSEESPFFKAMDSTREECLNNSK